MFYLKSHPLIIKKILGVKKEEIFLTFDDGPDAEFTPQILGLLKQFQAKANFFVIGKEAEKHPDLIKRILAEGHGIFSHSMDHQYFHYFKKQDHLKNWIQNSIQNLSVLTGEPAVWFGAPAGILTTPFVRAGEDL